jgi:plastocyanin
LIRLPVLVAALLAMPGSSRAADPRDSLPRAEVGRIAGIVEISTALAARRPRFRVYSDVGATSVPPRTETNIRDELRNVVVYLTPVSQTNAVATARDSARAPNIMAQVDERFEPRVLTVLQGARVEFPNRDDIYHNVFSLSSAKSFDLGRYPKGASKSVTFNKAGVVQVFCHIHSDMSAIVLVLGNEHHATPGADGRYVIENIPAGEYTVVGWHERTKPAMQRVRVAPGQTATINFSLPLTPQALK